MSRRRWGLAVAALAPTAYRRGVALGLRYDARRTRAGDLRLHLRFCRDDVRFTFPGDSSWATNITSKRELERWLERFVAARLQLHPNEIVVSGPLWRTTFCVRCTVHADTPEGKRIYENRAVLWGRMSWGRVRGYEVYEDTQKTQTLDEHLAARGI